jgi:hypothetical protein
MDLSELDIWNRVYWAINRPSAVVETKGMAEMPDKVPDTIPPLADESKKNNEKEKV